MEAYKEMQNNLDYLGIDIEGINNAVNATENIIGCDTVDYDIDVFNENVRANIDEIINAVSANESVLDKLTDIIISSYYNEAAYVLEEYAKSSGLEDVSFQAENKREYGKYQISAVVDGEIKPITSGDEIEELFEYLETERDLETKKATDIEQEITADSIIDIENDIQINDDYNKLDVYVVMDDQTLDTLMKRADMYEKSGYKDFDEIIGSSAIVNLYFVADEKGVDIVLTIDDGEKYHDVTFSEHPDENEFPLSHDESEMIREKLEHFLGKSAVEYLKAVKWEDMDIADIKQLTAKDITPEDITAMQEARYKFTDVYDYAKSRNLLLGELMGVDAIYDNRLITYHAEARDDYGKMYDIDEDTIQELENNILMIDESVAAEIESKYHLVVISREPGEEVLVPVVIRTEDKTLLPFSQMLEEAKALIPEKLEGYATPISETEDLPIEVKTMDKLSMLYDLANDELDMLYDLAERDKLYDLADAEFAGKIKRTNSMESDFLDIMRYMGVDLERINEAFHRAESIVTEGIGNEEDKRYQCEVLHGNVRDRFSETLQESVYSISKDSIADGLITQAFVDSYLNEAKTMVAEREQPKNEPPKSKKEKPSIELN